MRAIRAASWAGLAGLLGVGAVCLSARGWREGTTTAVIGKQANGTYLVPTGQTIQPAGENFTFDSRPVDMALSPDGKTLAVMMPTSLRFFDTVRKEFRKEILRGSHNLGGLVWAKDGRTLYSTGHVAANPGGTAQVGAVLITQLDADGRLSERKPIKFTLDSRIKPNRAAKESVPSGLALSADGRTLYATLFNNATLAAVDLNAYDPATGAAPIVETPVGSSPEKVIVSATGDKLYVANRGGKSPDPGDTMDTSDPVVVDPDTYKASTGTVSVVSADRALHDPDHALIKTIPAGLQPVAMVLSPDGAHLYAANANSDSISVIETGSDTVVETIPTSPAPETLAASCPNGLAVSPDGNTLYVTLGGDNAVEVLSLSLASGGHAAATRIAGLVPTAWFPLDVRLDRDGKRLLVINSKGIGSLGETVKRPAGEGAMSAEAGPGGVNTNGEARGHSVYAVLGSLSVIPLPDSRALARDTALVASNSHFDRMAQAVRGPDDPFWSRFKHAILVIKENRTYDQVLGDMPVPAGHVGGDPGLLMFGAKITPNQHALAREFGLFDNLYCTGAISADGHHWLNEAFADDYDERAMNIYPRSYPCCGTDPLVYAGNPFVWQAALKQGRTFHNYGEFGPLPSMKLHSDAHYDTIGVITEDRNRDVAHAERVIADIAAGEQGDKEKGLADLTFIWLSNNHTAGTRPGFYTPESCVADNDLALGKIVDTISHSQKYWKDEPTAIFVVEDDAQGGLDHVEGHRTVGLVISPFNVRGQINSANYNQLNMIRTIELILGLKPLNQFDAAALPMRDCFTETADFTPFTARKNEIALNLRNPPLRKTTGIERHWAEVSSTLDFSAPDRADPDKLTEALWHHTHGASAYPPPTAAIR